ncbi:MAG: hypothetical protein EOM62_08140 [Bacteroidia bacterium]|nr:hypothetical protein [Bacteroidia bacterium]
MRIEIDFQSLKDLSDIEKGKELIKILSSNGLVIEKIGSCEPIRDLISLNKFIAIWNGEHLEGGFSECYFLFRGRSRFKFTGMAIWRKGLSSTSQAVNGLTIWLNVTNKIDYKVLIDLGDELFRWSGAEYGYIAEELKDQKFQDAGNIYDYITNLRWVNYFGQSYINEPDFHIPEKGTRVYHGVRVTLAETPIDEILGDRDYVDSIKKVIGNEWFWDYPQKNKRRKPIFDRTAITKQ